MIGHEVAKTRRKTYLVSWLRVFVSILVVGVPRAALACPVCFGENDSPLTSAMRIGVIFMLIVVGVVLAAFASFFIYLMRRAKMVGTEYNTCRPIRRRLHFIEYPLEALRFESNESRRIFCHDPSRMELAHEAQKLGPEPSVVC